MKSGVLKQDGDERILVRRGNNRWLIALILSALFVCGLASAQSLYKYRGANGEWIYADRPPAGETRVERRSVSLQTESGRVSITDEYTGTSLVFTANNRFHAPVEVMLDFDSIDGAEYPDPDHNLRWVVPALGEQVILELAVLDPVVVPSVEYRYVYLPGDPEVQPTEGITYRAPFAVGASHAVTQAYPDSVTHLTRDSMYAVDFDLPVGTNVVAARDGIVFEIASTNLRGAPRDRGHAELANLVRILHDDGTYAVYAHLNRSTVRVSPGDRVSAGQYIADSGSSGSVLGPHLHFAVQFNKGMRVESLPVTFRGAGNARLTPSTGSSVTAHP
jgi:hypothetical protein